jgi:hypothetical protein
MFRLARSRWAGAVGFGAPPGPSGFPADPEGFDLLPSRMLGHSPRQAASVRAEEGTEEREAMITYQGKDREKEKHGALFL